MNTLHVVTETTELSSSHLEKIKRLRSGSKCQLKWHVIGHNRVAERHYIDAFRELWSSYKDDVQEKCRLLEQKLAKSFEGIKVNALFDRNWSKSLEKEVTVDDTIVIVRDDKKQPLSSNMLMFIGKTQFNVLVMGPRAWNKECKLLGAIDPFHEDDPKKLADKLVYQQVVKLRNWLNSNQWTLLHAIYIPPLAIQYKSDIINIHCQSTKDFGREFKIPGDHIKFLEGLPERVLSTYAEQQKVDLLVMGSRKHGMWDKWLNGSTIEALMEKSDVDILLARQK